MGTLLDDDMEWMEKYGKDYDHFHANYDEIYSKHKNEFVAVKNLKVYHDANPLKLLKLLRADGVETEHTFIQFLN
ncbi:MAG TPA: hypothetical protein VEX17_04740 [Bacillales bacterium]|nr:hypothetical protein [Bacillales bacterium]